MKNRLMVLAGTVWQIPIIKRIKEMGYEAHCVNLYPDSPAFSYADKHEVLDILDKNACLDYAEKNHIDAVISEQCDIATPTVAYVAKKLGLSGIGESMAELYTNKFAMREFCKNNGIPTPEYAICETLEQAELFFTSLSKKMIIKPLDSNSSRGVYTIQSLEELRSSFEKSMKYSHIKKAVLCERYIEGTEFTVDGVVSRSGHISLAISEKKHYQHNPNVAKELFFSYHNDTYDYDELRRVNNRFVDLSGLPFGLTHAEYKYENGRYYLIEIGARGGGNLIGSHIVPLMSGVDNYEYLINSSLGTPLPECFVISDSLKNRCCVLKFFDVDGNGGIVKEIIGEDFLSDSETVIAYKFNFAVGDTIKPAVDDSARVGYYIAYSDSKEALLRLMDKIEKTVKFIVE